LLPIFRFTALGVSSADEKLYRHSTVLLETKPIPMLEELGNWGAAQTVYLLVKGHKNENFFGFNFEFCTVSLLVMHK
jgi:hypothetical protein